MSSVRVSAETIENRPNASFVQTLSGQVPGLNITTSSGQPGGNSTVQLRGVSSINGDTEPLFIIDGTPVDGDNFRSLNPNDILTIDVFCNYRQIAYLILNITASIHYLVTV